MPTTLFHFVVLVSDSGCTVTIRISFVASLGAGPLRGFIKEAVPPKVLLDATSPGYPWSSDFP